MENPSSFLPLARQGLLLAIIALWLPSRSMAQVAWPDCSIQDVNWTSGTHDIHAPQKITSPGSPLHPVIISGSADAEFVSATAVELTPGFHAGTFTDGHFRARIDAGLGDPDDIVVIAPDPATSVHHGAVHVPKWEKLEVGIHLSQVYQEAIDHFFDHYYPNAPLDHTADPGNIDRVHDLNPYADDSLQLVMTLTSPSGVQSLKWGFFMREAMWPTGDDMAVLTESDISPLIPYGIRFRCAPDEEGTWQFAISIRAPHTLAADGTALSPLLYSGYSFNCRPPLADNHGPLGVNPANKRTLQFEDGTNFFGMGTNMADLNHWQWGGLPPGVWWSTFFKRDFDVMQGSMQQLHEAGGNFMRMFLMRHMFAPEWVNLGVYDSYTVPPPCDQTLTCNNALPTTGYESNCQYQCQMFDLLLDHARTNNIYLQLCIDPYAADFVYETFQWGAHPYIKHFVEANSTTRPYNVRELFYTGNTGNTDNGVFYYWKRKYKYILSRWGYSVNLPIIEPFNEIDQTLGYRDHDLSDGTACDICPENWVNWPADPQLPSTINQWVTDISNYVRGPVDLNDPASSPLGENDKLFLMSYASGDAVDDAADFIPFTNPDVDLMDAHKYVGGSSSQQNHPDIAMEEVFDHAQEFRTQFPSTDPLVPRKPFNHGESNYITDLDFGGQSYTIEHYFHNYDVSFHNELWSSAFTGNFATSLTWHWQRVFWWPDGLKTPPPDPSDLDYYINNPNGFSNEKDHPNVLNVNGTPVAIPNQGVQHHFQPLSQFLSNPSLRSAGFWDTDYSANKVYSYGAEVECYYLKDPSNSMAVGWVHNLNAWTMNNYFLAFSVQNFLGCDVPNAQSLTLTGFDANTNYFVTWFPTRMNSTVYPYDGIVGTDGSGNLTLDLTTEPFGGVLGNYLDTLHADYAFIIAPGQVLRHAMVEVRSDAIPKGWDFFMFPNPARDELNFQFQDDTPKQITIYDATGRSVSNWSNISVPVFQLGTDQLAKGAYYVHVTDGIDTGVKRLVVN